MDELRVRPPHELSLPHSHTSSAGPWSVTTGAGSLRSTARRALRRLGFPPGTRSVRFQSPNPRDLAVKDGDHRRLLSGGEPVNPAICRDISAIGVAPGSACHAEGRGFRIPSAALEKA